jgi:cysteinyl-tRNA synthetase
MDLKFPHHECEIAQATSANGKPPVNYWMHANMLTVNGQKMSKSLGNSFLPQELFSGNHPLLEKGYSPCTVRFFMLQSHYSSTLDFSNEALQAADKGYRKLSQALKIVKTLEHSGEEKNIVMERVEELKKLVHECFVNMSDDFNSAKVLAVLFEMASRINDYKSGNRSTDEVNPETFRVFKNTFIEFLEEVLGLREDVSQDERLLDSVLQVLIDLRKKAREDRNYALSDKIRDDLKKLGVQLMDGKAGEMGYIID